MLEFWFIGAFIATALLAKFSQLERKAKRYDPFTFDIIGWTIAGSWISVVILILLVLGTIYLEDKNE